MMKLNYRLFAIAFGVFSFALIAHAQSASIVGSAFNPNYIIDDDEILDYNSMTLDQIQDFLNSQGGFLSTYNATTTDGTLMSAAQIIYDRAVTNKVNPKFLLVLLQKESSLVELKTTPSQTRLDWAVGYGCPDSGGCSPRWQGFWKQINSASLQFRDYMDNPQYYTYKMNQTYTVNNTNRDPMVITPQNQATAALYNYTPHVYNGNYNFFNIWQRYFAHSSTAFPNGSLLQAKNEPGVWLIQDGKKRPFVSKGALLSRFDINKVIKVNKADLDAYPKGDPIKFSQYSVVRTPNGTLYLLVDNQKRAFASNVVFRKIGINPEEVINASWDDVKIYKDGNPITATSTYATGALLQNIKTGGVYWVIDGTKSPLVDSVFLKTKFKGRKIVKATPKELDTYKTIDPVVFDDGELLKSSISSSVFVIADGKKNAITSGKVFESLGYKWENVLTVSPKVLYQYAEGTVIKDIITNMQAINSQSKASNIAASPTTIKTSVQTSIATTTVNQIQ